MGTFVTHAGLAVLSLAVSQATTPPKYVGWGTGAGTASATSTDLSTPKDLDLSSAGPNRTTATLTQQTVTVTNDTLQAVATRTASGSGTVTNLGLFDASSSGNLTIIVDGQSVALSSGDSIQATFKLTFS